MPATDAVTIDLFDLARERVAAGAAYLDDNEPGWAARIDLNRLNLGSCFGCILGQLYGSYSGAPVFDEDDDRIEVAEPLGFDTTGPWRGNPSYEHLNAAWRTEIAARTAGPDAMRE